ncbi:hypothetical protein FMEAI12_6670006 [Parafrankia sp. Ea1.12]|nr:hypothetical protein FMEAI12_6670006 [Parafrankia sp. Ea1.12]
MSADVPSSPSVAGSTTFATNGPVATCQRLYDHQPTALRSSTIGSRSVHLLQATETESFVELAELRGRQASGLLNQVCPGQGDQPRARNEAWAWERDSQDTAQGQSLGGAHCHLDSHAADLDVRWSDDLYGPEPTGLLSREQNDRPPLIEVHPPDFAAFHVSSYTRRQAHPARPRRTRIGRQPRPDLPHRRPHTEPQASHGLRDHRRFVR